MAERNAVNRLVCANCQGHGKSACKACLLVLYCGRDCQKTHWALHKKDCKSPLLRDSWKPQWDLEDRPPAFFGGRAMTPFGGKKYLWGNVPALDILQLHANEGGAYDEDLRLLFAASGDLRNVVKTLAAIPETYKKSVFVHLNDRDFDIVARNLILLLIALVIEDTDEAVDCIIHVWYSVLIRQNDAEILRSRIRPLVEDVCTKIAHKAAATVLGKTWTFGQRSVRMVLTKEQWMQLLNYFQTREGLSPDRAQSIRTAVTLAPERRDYRERKMVAQVAAHRLCAERFREDGILLPFGQSRAPFNVPNPTFFQAADWPMKDSADVSAGWPLAEVLNSPAGPATNDFYGKLLYYLLRLLSSFHRRMSSLNIAFELSDLNAENLIDYLESGTFARIEVANISDRHYLGIVKTTVCLGPLLQPQSRNPHATLLTLFMNAVDETISQTEEIANSEKEIMRLIKYLSPSGLRPSIYDSKRSLLNSARALIRDVDKYFNRYMGNCEFKMVEKLFGMLMKEPHTIVEKWPLRLKLRPGQAGAQEEFDVLLSSAHTGNERYVEWKRAST